MKLWIVTYVDVSETCDGKARVLDVCKTNEDAKAVVKADMELWVSKYKGEDVIHVDFDKMSAGTDSYGFGCDWNIEEIEVSWLSE